MTLDESRDWRQAQANERERMRAREDRALDWADAKAARDELDATETVEAEASHWAGVFKQMPPYIAQTVYASGPG